MNTQLNNLKTVRIGLTLAVITILFGYGLGGVFGGMEKKVKSKLASSAQVVLKSVYKNDSKLMKKTVSKSWTYLKRSHLHAGAIGAVSIALILLLSFFPINDLWKTLNALALGLGAFGYSIFWLLAGFRAPSLGSTNLAKESLSWIAIPSAFMSLAGVFSILVIVVHGLYLKKE